MSGGEIRKERGVAVGRVPIWHRGDLVRVRIPKAAGARSRRAMAKGERKGAAVVRYGGKNRLQMKEHRGGASDTDFVIDFGPVRLGSQRALLRHSRKKNLPAPTTTSFSTN